MLIILLIYKFVSPQNHSSIEIVVSCVIQLMHFSKSVTIRIGYDVPCFTEDEKSLQELSPYSSSIKEVDPWDKNDLKNRFHI